MLASESQVARGRLGVRRLTLPHQVRQEFLEHVAQAGYQAGDRLPTEQEICERFGASRTAVREAMKHLEVLGIVSIEPGRGTFLRPFDVGNLLANLPLQLVLGKKDILEVIRVRQVLEEFCLEQAIVHGDEEGIVRLGACVEAMRARAEQGESMEAEDTCFHRELAQMSHSRLLLMILEIFWDMRSRWPHDNSPAALERRYQRHQRLYDAIKRRDLQLARCYLVEHFSGAYEELLPAMDATETGADG